MYEQNQQSGSPAQPPPYTPSPQPAQPKTPNNMSSKGVTYAIVAVVIVIVAGGIAFSLMGGSKSSNTIHNTTSAKKNSSNPTTPPNPLYSIISSNKSMSVKAFTQTLDSKLTNQLNVSYSGSLIANIKSHSTTQTSTLPLRIDLMKYNSNSRADVNISDIPLIGNLTLAYILNSGEMYTCAKVSGFSGFGSNSSNVTPGYQCQPPVASSSLITLLAANSSLINSSIHFTSIKQSSYNGNGCVLTSGYMLINQSSNSSTTGPLSIITGVLLGYLSPNSRTNATFNMCLSNNYYVPLTVTITEVRNASYLLTGSGTETVTMQLNETSLVTSVSPSITALPGPITNSSISISASSNPSASVP